MFVPSSGLITIDHLLLGFRPTFINTQLNTFWLLIEWQLKLIVEVKTVG